MNKGRTLQDIREVIIEKMKIREPSLTQLGSMSDPGTMLIDAVSEIADNLNYFIDKARLESYVSTATQVDSMFKLANWSSFFIQGVQPPSVELEITAKIDTEVERYEFDYGSSSYIILHPVTMKAGEKLNVVAYNAKSKRVFYNKDSISRENPTIKLGLATEIPKLGIRVMIDQYDKETNLNTIIEVPPAFWLLSSDQDGYVYVTVRDLRLFAQNTRNLLIRHLVCPTNFDRMIEGELLDTFEFEMVAKTSSTKGSGRLTYEETRRAIIHNNTMLNSLVSLVDFESIAEQDLEVRRAKAFDWNTPTIVTELDKVDIYISLRERDLELVPTSVTLRLLEEIARRNTLVGTTVDIKKAVDVNKTMTVWIKTKSIDLIDQYDLERRVIDKFSNLNIGEDIGNIEVENYIINSTNFIDKIDVTVAGEPVGKTDIALITSISIEVSKLDR